MSIEIQRQGLQVLTRRLHDPRRFLQVLAGPRQVGKTTHMRQSLASLSASPQGHSIAQHSVSADSPGLQSSRWLATQWETARALALQSGACIVVLDEVQKLPRWTDEVKRLWDEEARAQCRVHLQVMMA